MAVWYNDRHDNYGVWSLVKEAVFLHRNKLIIVKLNKRLPFMDVKKSNAYISV